MPKYIGVIHKDPGSDFGVTFPDFPGCVSAGDTLDEARAMGEEALRGHAKMMVDEGETLPEPSSREIVMADPVYASGVPFTVDSQVF